MTANASAFTAGSDAFNSSCLLRLLYTCRNRPSKSSWIEGGGNMEGYGILRLRVIAIYFLIKGFDLLLKPLYVLVDTVIQY